MFPLVCEVEVKGVVVHAWKSSTWKSGVGWSLLHDHSGVYKKSYHVLFKLFCVPEININIF